MKIRRITVGVLLVLSLLFLLDVKFLFPMRNLFGMHVRLGKWGSAAERTEKFSHSPQEISQVTVHNVEGGLEIRKALGNEVTVTAKLVATVPVPNRLEAEKKLLGWEVEEKMAGREVSYELQGPGLLGQEVEAFYLLEVPEGVDVSLLQKRGGILVTDFQGNLRLETESCQVQIKGFQGSLWVDSEASFLSLEDVAASVFIRASRSPIALGLRETEEGYLFDLDLANGTLKGGIPLKQEGRRFTGQWGPGLYPIEVKADFSIVTLRWE